MPASNDKLIIGAQFDIGPITVGMNESAAAVEAGAARMKASFERAQVASEYSVTEAKHALHGLGEEIGVHVPRFVQSFVAEIGGVGPILSAAFAPIAVVGLVGVLGEIPDAIEKGINKLQGWNEEAKKAFRESTAEAIDFEKHTIKLNEEIAKIALIGKSGPEKYALELQIAGSTTQQLIAMQDEYKQKIAATTQATTTLQKETTLWGANSWKNLAQGGVAAFTMATQMAASGKIIEQNKIQTELWSKALKEVSDEIEHRQKVEMPTIKAEGGVALLEQAKQRERAEERAAKQAQEAWHRTVIAELDDEERLAKESTRILAERAKENAEFDKNVEAEIKRADEAILRDQERGFQLASEAQRKALAEQDKLQRQWQAQQSERLKAVTADFNRNIVGWMNGAQTFGRTMQNVWKGIADNALENFLKMAEAFLRSKIMMMVATKEQQATEATAAAQGAAITQASMLREQFAAAKAGAGKAYSAMAGIPIIGPELGAIAGAATFAAIMAFAKGGIVPETNVALLHKNEMVLPSDISQSIQHSVQSGGGLGSSAASDGHTFNFNHYGPGTDAQVRSSSKQFMKEAMRELRRRGMSAA